MPSARRPAAHATAGSDTPVAPESQPVPLRDSLAARVSAHSPVALLAVDRDCRILFANDAAVQLLGETAQQLLEQRICALFVPQEGQEPAQWCPVHRLFAGQERRREPRESVVRVRGERRSVLLAIGPLDENAPPGGAIVTIVPVRHEGPLQEQRRHLVARLLHDLRTPLAGIGMASELLDPGMADMPAGILDALRMHHADLLRYISELADFTSLDMDARLPTPQPMLLGDAFEAVLWRLSPQVQRREQRLRIDNKATRPVAIAQHYLEQALMAVIFDVSTYTSIGAPIGIRAQEQGEYATIAVEGRGGALTDDEVRALTDPYLRMRAQTQTTGLMSLAATKHALDHYGGTLAVTARRRSLCIALTIPLASDADEQ